MAKAIGTLGTIDTITVGGRVFTDLTNLLVLTSSANTTVQRYGGFVKMGGSSGAYPVTGGKTLTIYAALLTALSGTTVSADLGSCTNALGVSTSSAPTGALYFSTNTSAGSLSLVTGAAAGSFAALAIIGKAAPTTYVFLDNNGSAGCACTIYGYES